MFVQQVQVLVGKFFAVHVLDAVAEHTAVEADEIRFWQLADQGGDIFLLNVGISVKLATCGRILCVAIVDQEVKFLAHFAIFVMLLAVQNIRLGDGIILFSHQRNFHLVLDFFHADAFKNVDTAPL